MCPFLALEIPEVQKAQGSKVGLEIGGNGYLFQGEFDLFVNSRLGPFWKVRFRGTLYGRLGLPRPTGPTLEAFLKGLIRFIRIFIF